MGSNTVVRPRDEARGTATGKRKGINHGELKQGLFVSTNLAFAQRDGQPFRSSGNQGLFLGTPGNPRLSNELPY